jgi:HEAT repeat protein
MEGVQMKDSSNRLPAEESKRVLIREVNPKSKIRRPQSHQCLAAAFIALLAGCVQPVRQTPPSNEQQAFRTEAIQELRRAAMCDDPVLRMQALEAFQDVAAKEGSPCIIDNIDNGYAGVSFAALMSVGETRIPAPIEKVRTLSEDNDANVRIAALFAMHRLGQRGRTKELADYLLHNPDARVRANAALAIGRLNDESSIRLLHQALAHEKKDAVKMQILEALAMLGDSEGIERLKFSGFSAFPDQASLALMCLANARTPDAEELFRIRLSKADYPETRLQAARGLGRLGYEDGFDLSMAYLFFRSPVNGRKNDPPEQQISRVRALAALALEAIGNPQAIGALRKAFDESGQSPYVRMAIARAAIRLIDGPPDDARARKVRKPKSQPRKIGDEPMKITANPQADPGS